MSRRALIERVVRELAAYERPSASEGERRAAQEVAQPGLGGKAERAGHRGVAQGSERGNGEKKIPQRSRVDR